MNKKIKSDALSIANRELAFQNKEKGKRAAELNIADKEPAFQNEEKEKRAEELIISTHADTAERKKNEEYIGRMAAIVEFSDDAIVSKSLDGTIKSWNTGGEKMFGYTANEAIGENISLIIPSEFIYEEKQILQKICNNESIEHFETIRIKKNGERFHVAITVSPLKDQSGNIIGISKIVRDITQRKKSEEQLIEANNELVFQNEEKENRAAELLVANKELAFQNEEKENRAAELLIANKELAFQNEEKENRAAELLIANKELAFQNEEKGNRAAELIVANKELAFQNEEKENRAAELLIANKELAFQNEEKENRAAELLIANKELAFQNEEKGNRAAELIVANKELAFQNEEKEKRAAELIIANKELAFQNEEKEKRAAELTIANEELKKAEYHISELNIGLEQKIVERTAQLEAANKELESFSYSISHDLRAPLRAINGFTRVLVEDHLHQLDAEAKTVLDEITGNSKRMGELIDNLLEFSHIGKLSVSVVSVDINELVEAIITELKQREPDRNMTITVHDLHNIKADKNMLRQVFINLISNAVKYTGKKEKAVIEVGSYCEDKYCTYYIKDNGAGFDMQYYDKLFGVFQRLHSSNEFEGAGVGLAIIKRIITKHGGRVWATGKVDEGACFYISLPNV